MSAMSAASCPDQANSVASDHEAGTTTILLVRHTEVHNPDRIFYGRLPGFGLSEWGQKGAERTAELLAARPVVAIYSSPLLRARQTAERIAARHPGAARHDTELLQEIGTSWQGTPYARFAPGFNVYDNRRHDDDETIADIRDRMVAFVEEARLRHPGGLVVGVSHCDPITILRLSLTDRPLTPAAIRSAEHIGFGSVTEIAFAPGADLPRLATLRP